VEVRATAHGAELEAGALEVGADERQRMDVVAHRAHERLRFRQVVLVPAHELLLIDPPGRGALVEAGDVELVDHHRSSGAHEIGEPGERLRQRLHVVQRHHRHGGVERAVGGLDLVQMDLLDGRTAGWVDREHVVAEIPQRRRELPLPRADLHNARGRSGQCPGDESEELVVDHVARSLTAVPDREPGRPKRGPYRLARPLEPASQRPPAPTHGPIFIVGPMGSGTTLLRLMLDSHEHIAIPHETAFMRVYNAMHFAPFKWSGKHWAHRLGWSFHEVDEQARDYFERLFRRYADEHGAERWGEKTPHHTWHISSMKRLFPDSVFIAIVRHPGATVASNMRRFGHARNWATSHVQRYHREIARQAGRYQRRMIVLRYEDLVLQPEQVMRELLDWLGEPWSDNVLKHDQIQRTRTRRIEGRTVPEAVDTSRTVKWVTEMTEADRVVVARRTEGIARFYGYSFTDPEKLEPIGRRGSLLFGGQEVRDRIAQFPELDIETQGEVPIWERHYHPHEMVLMPNPYGRPRFQAGQPDAAAPPPPSPPRRALFKAVGKLPGPLRRSLRRASARVRRARRGRIDRARAAGSPLGE